jgi:hypothetical protein
VRFEIESKSSNETVGTVEWQGPGQVQMDMRSEAEKAFFERYFHTEQSYMAAAGNHDGMTHEKPVDSEQAFNHAMYQLAAYAYKVRQGDSRRRKGASGRAGGDNWKGSA